MERYDIRQGEWRAEKAEAGDFVLYADAQATVEALQAQLKDMVLRNKILRDRLDLPPERCAFHDEVVSLQAQVKELEAIKTPDDAFTYCAYCGEKSPVDEHNEDLAAHIKVCPKHPMRDVESQLTQRTAECDALKLVNDTHMKTVMKLSHVVEQRTAELEAAKRERDVWYARYNELSGVKDRQLNDLQAELERVRGELVEATHNVNVYQSLYSTGCMDRALLENELRDLRTLIAALPKVEGEINERFCTGSYYSSPRDYRTHVTFEAALVALLKHRQGMEG